MNESGAEDTDGRLGAQRDAFDVPPEVAYFNTANLSPQLRGVRAAGNAALDRRATPWTISAEDWFSDVEILRSLFGGLIGADAEGIALVPATSYGFAVAAGNLALAAVTGSWCSPRNIPQGSTPGGQPPAWPAPTY